MPWVGVRREKPPVAAGTRPPARRREQYGRNRYAERITVEAAGAVSAGVLSPYRSYGPHRMAGCRYTALNRTLGRETTVSAHVHALRIFYASRKRPMAYADDGFVQYTYWSATFVKSDVRGPACDEQWVFALCR